MITMPVCKGCGGSYDDNVKFCPNCGRAKPEPETLKVQVSVTSEDKWETCKIYRRIYQEFKSESSYTGLGDFWAEAIGPNGKYFPGESPPFLNMNFDMRVYKKEYMGAWSVEGSHNAP
jgi:hypothetical protein